VHVHADPGADEDTDHRVRHLAMETGANPDGDRLAARHRGHRFSGAVADLYREDLAGAITVAEAGSYAVILYSCGSLLFQDKSNVTVDDVFGRSVGFDAAVQQQNGAVRELFDQSEVV